MHKDVVDYTIKKLKKHKLKGKFLVGTNKEIPFKSKFFDYVVGWNVSYYMENEDDVIEDHIKELSRVVKKNGKIICSFPKKNCFHLIRQLKLKKTTLKLN